jgi:hypothetical protein
MISLNQNKSSGGQISVFLPDNGSGNIPVYLSDQPGLPGSDRMTAKTLGAGKFYSCPRRMPDQRDYWVVFGSSGSGKTQFSADTAQLYHYTYPRNKIYYFSVKTKCSKFDTLDYVQKVHQKEWKTFMNVWSEDNKIKKEKKRKLKKKSDKKGKKRRKVIDDSDSDSSDASDDSDDDSDVEEIKKTDSDKPVLATNSFADCLMIFDDFENVAEEYRDILARFKAYIIQVGREAHIDVIECLHILLNGSATRISLHESTHMVFFPTFNPPYHALEYLERYMGMKKGQRDKLIQVPTSRWLLVYKNAPNCVLTPERIVLVKALV